MKRLFLRLAFLGGELLFLFSLSFFGVQKTQAATLSNVSDLIGTSRPSASAPLNSNQAASATQVTVIDNSSIFLASDSATFRPDTGETIDIGKNVASMSAQISGTPNTRIVYFTNTVTNTHHAGDPVVIPITAMHKIQFTTVTAVPTLGKITLTFPALTTNDANNAASPSATTFQLNGLADANVKINGLSGAGTFTGTYTNPTNGTSPTIAIALTGTTYIPASTAVTILLGCSAQSGGNCTTSVPTIINPTKTAAAGTADIWKLIITTRDVTNSQDLDTSKIKIGTVEAVQVQATVDPSLTVVIAGLANGANFNSSSTSCASETTNAGTAATATTVDLGALGSANINIAGQTVTVSTNAPFGYVITATSSGRLINAASGNWLTDANGGNGLTANDTPVPAVLPASGNPAFGIAPCGARVPTSSPNWAPTSALAFGSGGRLSNPWNSGTNSYYATIASYTGGAVANEVTVLRYAATVAATTPAGVYTTIFTYVVTPTF